jgi:hypothetical protein
LGVVGLLAAGVAAAGPVIADTSPPAGTLETATADPQPTWQTDGIVWGMAKAGSFIVAGGDFGTIRPPGAAVGDSRQQVRNGVASFNIATGEPTVFRPEISGTPFSAASNPSPGECDPAGTGKFVCKEVLRVKVSPDGGSVYLGGDFDHAQGLVRQKLAAYDLHSGALSSLSATINSRVRAIAVSNTTVYIGGDFTSVNGQPRTRLAAFNRSTGALLPWAPTADRTVYTMAMSTDGSRVILGGVFDHVNGATINGIASVNAGSGASMPWSSRPVPPRSGAAYSTVWDLVVDGNTVYAGANGFGPGVFDGRFAADTATGNLIWKDSCLGATSAIALMKGVLYSASHAHNCSDIGAFPEITPRRYQRLLAETADSHGAAKPTLLHWFPLVNPGPANSYYQQGPWAMANDDTNLWVGGEFTTAGGQAQQGLTRYVYKSTAADTNPPEAFSAPLVTSRSDTSLGVSWQATWDRDNANLSYSLFRDGGSTPIYTVAANSNFWTLPVFSYVDTVAAGSSHTYTVTAKDVFGNTRSSPTTSSVTATNSALGSYGAAIAASGASPYWRLNDTSGTVAADATGTKTGNYGAGITLNQPGAAGVAPNVGIRTSGTDTGILSSATAADAPMTYSLEFWFNTTFTTGGKLIGFGNAQTGTSTSYDRQVYLNNVGKVVFGVWTGGAQAITSPAAYTNGAWHHVVATQDTTGMALYIDGTLVGTNSVAVTATAINGYWRVGGDNLNAWPGKPASNWFHGSLDDVAIYPTALTPTQVASHWSAAH